MQKVGVSRHSKRSRFERAQLSWGKVAATMLIKHKQTNVGMWHTTQLLGTKGHEVKRGDEVYQHLAWWLTAMQWSENGGTRDDRRRQSWQRYVWPRGGNGRVFDFDVQVHPHTRIRATITCWKFSWGLQKLLPSYFSVSPHSSHFVFQFTFFVLIRLALFLPHLPFVASTV